MKRKVNLAGPTTLTVSLPSKWAKQHNIRKGDEIEVVEEGERLILSSSVIPSKKEIVIHIPRAAEFLQRFLYAPYIKGYDVITVRFDDIQVYDKVLQGSKLLMGFEMIEKTSNSCKLVNISTKLEQNFDVLLGRLFLSGIEFGKELLMRLNNGKMEQIHDLLEYEFNCNRLSLFCKRVIQTGGSGQINYSTISLYNIVSNLEKFTDNFRDIVETIGKSRVRLNKNTKDLFNACISVQEINFKLFNQLIKGKDIQSQLGLFKEHKRIRKTTKHNTCFFDGDVTNSYICSKLIEAVESSHHISEELFV